jgi:hypothetical protein
MTDQYGRGRRPRRVLVALLAVLCTLVSDPTAALAVDAADASAPTPTPAPRTIPAVQATWDLTDKRIVNPTGLAVSTLHRGVVWMISGRTLFAVQAGRTTGTFTFSGPAPVDFEALAISKDEQGHSMLLLGDTGDPHRSRKKGAWLYMVAEPTRLGKGTLRPQRYQLEYPDGPQDVRSLLVDPANQRVYLVSLTSTGGDVYAVPAALGLGMSNLLTKVNPVHFVAQDGGFLPNGRVLMRGKNQSHLLEAIGGRRLAYLQMPRQADGPVAIEPGGGSVLVTGSAPKGRLWQLRIPDVPDAPPLPSASGAPTIRPVPVTATGPLSGHLAGMVSLAGIVAIALLGLVLHLRRRTRTRAARRPQAH